MHGYIKLSKESDGQIRDGVDNIQAGFFFHFFEGSKIGTAVNTAHSFIPAPRTLLGKNFFSGSCF